MVKLCILGCFLYGSCSKSQEGSNQDKQTGIQNDALRFLNSKQYRFSTSKVDIPTVVIDRMSHRNKQLFVIGDSSEIEKISFSDARLLQNGKDIYPYHRLLHFVIVNKDQCLLVYSQGGIGRHTVVEYLQNKPHFKQVVYTTGHILADTNSIREFLKSNPQSNFVTY